MATITATVRENLIGIYIGMFKKAPGADSVSEMVVMWEGGKNQKQIAAELAKKAAFTAEYPQLQLPSEFADEVVAWLAGEATSAGKTWATNWIIGKVNAGVSKSDIIVEAVLALRAATNLTDFGNAKTNLNNKVEVGVYHAVTKDQKADSATVIDGVTSAASTVTEAKAEVDGVSAVGQTYTLTTGVDTKVGASGNDTFDGGTSASLSSFDNLDGGAGTDTLTALIATAALPGSLTVKNIEKATINTTAAGFIDSFTGWTGLTDLTVQSSTAGAVTLTAATTTAVTAVGTGASAVTIKGGAGAVSVTTGGAAIKIGEATAPAATDANQITSATTSGGSTVAITDNSGAAGVVGNKLTTVSITSAADDQTITGNGITTLSLNKLTGAAAVGDTTITSAAGTRALTVTYNGVDVAGDGAATAAGTMTLTDAEATSLNIKAVTAASYDVTVAAAKATAVTIDAAVKLQMDALTAGVATTVGISGAGAVEITADTLDAAVVITSTNTGGVTLTQDLTVNQQFVGTASSGADKIGVTAAFTKAISTGAGNDEVTYGGAAATGGSIDAGDGTDTISMTAALAATATGSATFAGTVSNFEVLSIGATAAATTINMANADGMNTLKYAGTGATFGLTVNNAAAGFTLAQTAANAEAVSVALANATGTNDTVNLSFAAADGFSNAALVTTIADVENLVITTDDTDTTAATTAFTSVITAAAVKTVTVSGDAGFNASTGLVATTLTSFDASGVTATGAGGAVSLTTGNLVAAATLKGGAGTNTINASAVTGGFAMTITGGAGTDTLTGGAGADVINGGNGTNTLVGNAGADTIVGGSGVDTITGGTGADTITGGAGADVFVYSTIGDSNRLNLDTITDLAVGTGGDSIQLKTTGTDTGVGGGVLTATAANVSLAGTFLEALDIASAGNGGTNGIVSWFQYSGNTYLVHDRSASTTNDIATDVVIKISGVVDLLAGTNLAITFVL